uniref:Putative ovule protein n=1 Tax=Solanum chacoense TaxID=4108 RepID=A0A0V0GRW2_SOLCH
MHPPKYNAYMDVLVFLIFLTNVSPRNCSMGSDRLFCMRQSVGQTRTLMFRKCKVVEMRMLR